MPPQVATRTRGRSPFRSPGLLVALLLAGSAAFVPIDFRQIPAAQAAEPDTVSATTAPQWNALFAGRQDWVGGDAAYSVAASPNRVLWFFGDTLWGRVRTDGGRDATMANNSVGVQSGNNPNSPVRFYAGDCETGPPPAVFVPADKRGWFWPQAPVVIDGRLYLFLAQVAKTGDADVLSGFRHVGQWLAVIDNPNDEPPKWQVAQHRLPFATFDAEAERSFGSAVLVQGAHVYVFGDWEQGRGPGKKQLIVARAPADKMTDLSTWRFRTTEGWTTSAADATALAGGLATEFSVSLLADRRLVLIYTDGGLSDKIMARFADAPEGPWSAPERVYSAPEMARDEGLFCYAAKAHPWATTESGEVLISYCTNCWDFGRLFRDETIYRPKFVRLKLAQ